MRRSQMKVDVPEYLQEKLQPYTEIYANIVIPIVRETPWGCIDQALTKRLRREIAGYANRNELKLHRILLYFGLMFCCMHATQHIMARIKSVNMRTRKINLVNKARLLIFLAYEQEHLLILPQI